MPTILARTTNTVSAVNVICPAVAQVRIFADSNIFWRAGVTIAIHAKAIKVRFFFALMAGAE
jgi:hypothetical protein